LINYNKILYGSNISSLTSFSHNKKNSEEIAAQISLVHNCKMKRT